MEPFYFREPGRQLFAWYHPALSDRGELTVICPPLFGEYMRTHQALRELSIGLAARGQHVIRFDYRGTGDSACDLSDVRVDDWVADVRDVIQEGKEVSGASVVNLVGVRVGGLLAMLCAASTEIRHAVIW